jgi:hypothetical protein
VNLHHGKFEDAVVRAVIQHTDGLKLQVDVVGLDLTALYIRSFLSARDIVDLIVLTARAKSTVVGR